MCQGVARQGTTRVLELPCSLNPCDGAAAEMFPDITRVSGVACMAGPCHTPELGFPDVSHDRPSAQQFPTLDLLRRHNMLHR